MNRKVLVTGGCGYIGSHVCLHLQERGYEVVVVDNLSSGVRENLAEGAQLYEVDLLDHDGFGQVFLDHRFDAVLHFAASIAVDESVRKPASYYRNNVGGLIALLDGCRTHDVRRLIFSSTAAVYGSIHQGPVREDLACHPESPYASSKHMGELVLRDVAAVSDLKYIALRYFNVAGADGQGRLGQRSKKQPTHLIKVACEAALGVRKKLEIYGSDWATRDGTCIRDYIHIDDLAVAHVMALDNLLDRGETMTLNCGYGLGYSVKEVIAGLESVIGRDIPKLEVARRPGDVESVVADAELIKEKLGWQPQHADLGQILKSAWDWECKMESLGQK